MAKIVTAAEIDVQLKGTESLKSLKTQIREAKEEAAQLSQKFGAFSPEALKATQNAANLADEMTDLNHRISALNPDKFSKIATVANGIASGITAAQGAMGLFGAESEETEKMLLKVQSAMALSQGLQGLGDAQQQIGSLAKLIGGKLKAAFTSAAGAARAVGTALGIGILLAAVSLLITYWEDIVELLGFGKTEQEKLTAAAKEQNRIEQEKLDKLDSQSNVLKLQGLSERDILNLKRKQIKLVIEAAEAELLAAKNRKEEQIASTKRYASYLESALKFVSIPLTVILKTVDGIGKVLGKDWNLEDKIFKPLSNLVFDPEKTEKKADETIKQAKDGLDKFKNQQAGFELEIIAQDKAANDKRISENQKRNEQIAADNAKAAEEAKKKRDEAEGIRAAAIQENEDRYKSEFELKLERLTNEFEKEKELLIAQGLSTKEIQEKFDMESAELWSAKLSQEYDDKVAADEKRTQYEKAQKQKELDEAKKIAEAKANIEQSAYNTAAAFSNLIGALGNENIKVQKAQALISIGIDTAGAISKLVLMSQSNSANAATGGIAGALQFATGILQISTNMAKAKSILGNTGSVPAVPNIPSASIPNTDNINQQRQQDVRVYVTETDIADATTRRINLTKIGIVQ